MTADRAETIEITSQTKSLGTLSQRLAFIMFLGIPSLSGPLAIWLFNRDNPHVEYHAREALNFNISMALYVIVSGSLILLIVGIFLLPIVLFGWFALTILAAANGEY